MLFASDFPVLGVFLTILWLVFWVLWLYLLFRTIADIVWDYDLGGWGKAAWLAFVILVPYVGVLVYLIARGTRTHERGAVPERARATAAAGGVADELARLAAQRDQGAISEAEFNRQKASLLA